ncbi:hypothetical protein NMY22_g2453 [Coprinellus aureogranulatus]|nr:hypothetical protein NMY22_g2453 [Coprinellus aureogranulatus]
MPIRQSTSDERGGRSVRSNRIPDSALTAAKEAETSSELEDLFRRIDASNFRIEFLDVLFYHLRPEWMDPPSLPLSASATDNYHAIFSRASKASLCASKGLDIAISFVPAHLRLRVAEYILDHIDDYASWLKYLLSGSVTHKHAHLLSMADPRPYCRTLLRMVEDETLGPLLMQSAQVIDYLIAVWIAINPLTKQPHTYIELDEECPIFAVLLKFLSQFDTRQMICDSLYCQGPKAKKLRNSVVAAAVSRCVQVAELDKEALSQRFGEVMAEDPDTLPVVFSPLEAALETLNSVFQIVKQLCEHPGLASTFLKSTFLEKFAQAIEAWLIKKASAGDQEEYRMWGFRLLNGAQKLVEAQARKLDGAYWKLSRTAFMRLIRGGFLSVLCEGLRKITSASGEDEADDWVYIRQCLVYLQNQCYIHPTLCKPTREELVKILGAEFWRTEAFRRTGWTDHWKAAALVVVAGCLTPLQATVNLLCDNIHCQEEDWKALHRDECDSSPIASNDTPHGKEVGSCHRAPADLGHVLEEGRHVGLFQRREIQRQQIAQVTALKGYLELRLSPKCARAASKGPFILSMETGSPSKVITVEKYLLQHGTGREEKLVSAYLKRRAEGAKYFLVHASTAIAGYAMENLLMVRANEENIDVKARLKEAIPRTEPICTVLCYTATFMDISSDEELDADYAPYDLGFDPSELKGIFDINAFTFPDDTD